MSLRHALRSLWASPGFSLAAVLSVAIGVGANTALFSVASALLLTPLAYAWFGEPATRKILAEASTESY